MIMEDDHDLDLQIFRNNPNCNWEVSSSYKLHACGYLQQPSAPLYPHLPKSHSPPAGSLCRDTQGTLGDSPLVAGGG